MRRVVHLVADWAAGDPNVVREVSRAVRKALPGAVVHVHAVAPGDSLAAGCCAAHLLLAGGRPPRIVAHDVAPADGADPGEWWAARGPGGTLVLGANVGWAWSFLRAALEAGPCVLDVPARRTGDPGRRRLVVAIRHLAMGHPHGIHAAAEAAELPALPVDVVAWADAGGNLKTTIARLPAPAGERVRVGIGPVSELALVSDGGRRPPKGQLALAATPLGVELMLGDGDAGRRFGSPPSGTPVSLEGSQVADSTGAGAS